MLCYLTVGVIEIIIGLFLVTVSVAYFNGKVSDCQTNNQIRFVRSGEIY